MERKHPRQNLRRKTESKKLKDISREKEEEEEEKRNNRERSRNKSKEHSKSERQIINNIFQENKTKFISQGLIKTILSDSGIFSKYEEINKKEILNKSEDLTKVINIMKKNGKKTITKEAQSLGQELYTLIKDMKKTDDKYSFPFLKFNQSLNDKEFMEIIKNSINYFSGKMSNDYVEKIKTRLLEYENEIKGLFLNDKLIKDILENALITILTNEEADIKEQDNNFSLLTINSISKCPLIKLPFKYNDNSIDINKKNIIEIALSYIPFLSYKNTLSKFTNKKIDGESLNYSIVNYINSHEFYFVNLKDDLNAITIHTGDIFINVKYLREYFENINNNDNNLIIREKIILVILHELNHGLIRTIDTEKYSNYLINSKRKNKKKNMKIRYKGLTKGEFYQLPIDETGNNFDYLLYAGYYFEYLDTVISKFFLNITKYDNKKIYAEELEICIKNMSHNISKVNKFRINYKKPRSQCAFSLFRNYRLKKEMEKINKKIDNQEYANIEDKDKNEDEIINKNDIIDEEEDEIINENDIIDEDENGEENYEETE